MRRALTLFALSITLAAPAAALGQSAGDEQYSDPFGPQDQPQQEPQQPAAPQEPAVTEAAPQEPAQSSTASEGLEAADSVPAESPQPGAATLPVSGLPALVLLGGGVALMAAGAALRRRL